MEYRKPSGGPCVGAGAEVRTICPPSGSVDKCEGGAVVEVEVGAGVEVDVVFGVCFLGVAGAFGVLFGVASTLAGGAGVGSAAAG